KSAALLPVQLAHRQKDSGDDLLVRLGGAGRIDRLPLPLDLARRVGEAAVRLRESAARKLEHFGLDPRWIGSAILLGRLPEGGGLDLIVLADHQPAELRERVD